MSHFQIGIFSAILLLLIVLAAFFSLAETALMAINRYRLRHKARLKNQYAIQLLHLLKRPDRLLGAILIGSTFTNILASTLATLISFHFFGEKGALGAAIILTFVILIFAEIAPKTLAAIYPNQVSRWVVFPIRFFLKLMYPLVWLANTITNGLLRLIRVRIPTHTVEPLSREELRSVVYETTGKISRQYQNMLLNILDLSKLTVDDVMVPKHEMIGIDIESDIDTITEQIKQVPLDWIPVYQNDINQILGLLHVHDMIAPIIQKKMLNKEDLQAVLRTPYFVPEGTALHVQLAHFQQSHDKVAIIVDEYGEIQGVLTLTDILEEIVGHFTPLETSKQVAIQPDGSYFIDGAMTIREFNRATSWDLPTTGPRTINGLIVEHLQALPQPASCILINEYPIEIIQVKQNRVKLARIFPKRIVD